MTFRRCDRYLLWQMLGPFLLALAGLSLFIILNLVLQLSDLMVDRGIRIGQILRLLVLWMPELIAWALPMAALFAVFLGLGRMEHDREIMALESIGVSLRRLLAPLLVAGLAISILTFAVYNWAMPVSKQAAESTYRQILFSESVPRISANTFFTGQSDQYFYVRQYDADSGSVRDVLIYDVSGQLFPQAESQITLVTADEGEWTNDTWVLSSGRMYGFDRDGLLVYSATFEALSLPVGQTVDQIWAQSRSPSEMGIAELLARIERARESGLPVSESIVELHQRFALPLSAWLFVLVGGTVSLMFGSKNRSTGIIISLLIIGLYQGAYFWMQALGRRGAMPPALAAWAPNLLFGILGGLLYLRVDRLASRDMWNRLRNRLPFLTAAVLLVLVGIPGGAQDVPLHLECEDLYVSSDRTQIRAQGTVRAELEDAVLHADELQLVRGSEGRWDLEAEGNVTLDFGDFRLDGDRIVSSLTLTDGGLSPHSMSSSGFQGQTTFQNSSEEEHTLYFLGTSGEITFHDNGEIERIDIRDGELTTCYCCNRPIRTQPYALSARRLLVYPSDMIVAFGLTGRIGGVPTLWLPVYVQPLEETLESPLFPAFGRDSLHGWFLKWNLPFYLSETLYGTVRFDYFSRYQELGGGVILRYSSERQRGTVDVFAFPAVIGDDEYRVSLDHSMTWSDSWSGSASLDYSQVGGEESLTFAGRLVGDIEGWDVSVDAARSWTEEGDVITQRLPDLSASGPTLDLGPLGVAPSASAGWVREWHAGLLTGAAFRWQAELDITLEPFDVLETTIAPMGEATVARYEGDEDRTQSSLSVSIPLERDRLQLVYEGALVSGESPFEYDRQKTRSHLAWSVATVGLVSINIDGGIDLTQSAVDPLEVSVSANDVVTWRTTLTYDLATATLEQVDLLLSAERGPYAARVEIPYDPPSAKFEDISFEISSTSGASEWTMSGTWIDGRLDAADGSYSLRLDSGWGLTLSTGYDAARPGSFSNVAYGLFRDIADCLRVGVERRGNAVWVYGSVLAFPEAVLRYAPEAGQVQLGD